MDDASEMAEHKNAVLPEKDIITEKNEALPNKNDNLGED